MVSLGFSFDASPWHRAFEDGLRRVRSLRPVLEEVGNIGVALTQRNIEASGGPTTWPDLAPSTLIARARHPSGPERGASRQVFKGRANVGPASSREDRVLGYAGARALTKRARRTIENAKPLIWTRELLRTIRKSVGEDYVDYGSGLIKSWTLFLGSRTVPARNPFGRTAADNASIMGAFMRHIFGHLKGQA
jgi:hypothetical protein